MKSYRKSWLVGGTVGLLAYAALSLSLIPFGTSNDGWIINYPYWIYPTLLGAILPATLLSPFFDVFLFLETWLGEIFRDCSMLVIAGAAYFTIGALIGWVYGKVKSQ